MLRLVAIKWPKTDNWGYSIEPGCLPVVVAESDYSEEVGMTLCHVVESNDPGRYIVTDLFRIYKGVSASEIQECVFEIQKALNTPPLFKGDIAGHYF